MSRSRDRLCYMVGGLRISVGPLSTTPGPRTHIMGFTDALRRIGIPYGLLVASDFPGLGRFARIPQGTATAAPRAKVLVGDLVRVMAALWSGVQVAVREWPKRRETAILYERMAVFQSLSSFHPAKRHAFRVVESQSLLATETARDRRAIVLERTAAWVERRAFRRADLVVAVSPGVGDGVAEFAGIPREKILVLPNATSRELTEVPLQPDGKTRVGFVGSVTAWHRLERLLKAIADLGDPDVVLDVIGDGPALGSLRGLSSELGLDGSVTFWGRMSHSEAVSRLASWSIGYAGHEKTWAESMYHSPLKLYEYAAFGLQILCTTSPDASTLKADGVAVHDFEAGDAEALNDSLRACIRGAKEDTSEARQRRRAVVSAKHSWESRVQEFLECTRARLE